MAEFKTVVVRCTKGRINIPKEIREMTKLPAGYILYFIPSTEEIILQPVKDAKLKGVRL